MQFKIFAIAALVASVTAGTIPVDHDHDHDHDHVHEYDDVSPAPRSVLEARDSFDCKGSSMCQSVVVGACDDAVNNRLRRDNVPNYGAAGSGRPWRGACSTVFGNLGCGIHIQGKSHCARSGNEMWWDYQDIRKNGCKKCGTKHWGDGCMTTVNYVSACKTGNTGA